MYARRFAVNKRYPLTISRGTNTGSENLLVTVEHEGITGMGEMAPATGATVETAHSTQAIIDRWRPVLSNVSPWDMQQIEALLQVRDGERAAFCALDCALRDWQGKAVGLPVWKMLGLNLDALPPTSLTIGINPPDVIRIRVPETLARTGAKFLKIKLGNPLGVEADMASVEAAQEVAHTYAEETGQPAVGWRVDANGGWTVCEALQMMDWLAARQIAFVEQPLPRGQEADMKILHRNAPLPLYLDESVRIAYDIPPLATHVDGVVLKILKCGGISGALRVIHTARAHGLKIMVGCFSESTCGITAAAHLAPLVDDLDLDSHLNILTDPFVGATYADGIITPTNAPGLGVHAA